MYLNDSNFKLMTRVLLLILKKTNFEEQQLLKVTLSVCQA